MKAVAILFLLLASPLARADNPEPVWSCGYKFNDYSTFELHCGGATLGEYKSALACVKAHKEICGQDGIYTCGYKFNDYSTFVLTCGGAEVGEYKSALDCIKAKRTICD